MTEETFWRLIEEAKAERTPALSNQAEILTAKLEALSPAEIVQFDEIFEKLHAQAYRWDLWAAAFIIEGGCSDDGFADFRAGLIGLGKQVYEDAIRDPASLVRQPTKGVDFSDESMLHAAKEAYTSLTGEEMPDHDLQQPEEPIGEPWDEDTVGEKYPELAAKFGFE
jgi:hypothetical protein